MNNMNMYGAPPVTTGNQSGQIASGPSAIWAAALPGLANPASQQAVQQQLIIAAKKAGNKNYITNSIKKLAPSLTNGSPTQQFVNSQPFTFNLPQPNNAYARGIVVRTTLAYTLAAGTAATYGATAGGALSIYDNIEILYNKSQIKFRPLWLRHLALAGALDFASIPSIGSTDGGGQNDATYLGPYLSPAFPVAVGANTYQQDFWIPFNILSPSEDRGLLPTMPGETGIQVKLTTAASLFGIDPVYNSIYETGGTGGAVSAVSGTIKVIMVYNDGEIYSSPTALSYDMSTLNGTIQIQQDSPLTNLIAGAAFVNRGALTILGKHYYVGLLIVDGNQSNFFSILSNINYLESSKDGVGANVFWKYGQSSNLDVQDFYWQARQKHKNHDLDPGVVFMIEGPLAGSTEYTSIGGFPDGNQYLDNSTSGWPAWHYGVGLNTVNTLGAGTARIEPFCIYVNPIGLPPV